MCVFNVDEIDGRDLFHRRAAFTRADPKSAKKTVLILVFLRFQDLHKKAASRTLMKLTLDSCTQPKLVPNFFVYNSLEKFLENQRKCCIKGSISTPFSCNQSGFFYVDNFLNLKLWSDQLVSLKSTKMKVGFL